MLTCIPQSLCSWDFRVLGASAGPALLTVNARTEDGGISLDGMEYSIRKHRATGAHWTLERDGERCADAQQPKVMFRSFEICAGVVRFTLKARSAHTRCYDMISDGSMVGTIRPAHLFTRRAFVECDSSVTQLAQLFAFWIAAITWRREVVNSPSAP